MIPDNFKTLIEKLTEKTSRKEIIWTKTSRDDEFKLALEKGAITIDRWNSDELNEQLVDMTVLNEDGDRIDYISFSYSEKDDFKSLADLHSLAKRAYYKVDETFKSIFKELDSNKTIGREEETDLPF
ncbi:hypothetical protein [Pedobacter steynii]